MKVQNHVVADTVPHVRCFTLCGVRPHGFHLLMTFVFGVCVCRSKFGYAAKPARVFASTLRSVLVQLMAE